MYLHGESSSNCNSYGGTYENCSSPQRKSIIRIMQQHINPAALFENSCFNLILASANKKTFNSSMLKLHKIETKNCKHTFTTIQTIFLTNKCRKKVKNICVCVCTFIFYATRRSRLMLLQIIKKNK